MTVQKMREKEREKEIRNRHEKSKKIFSFRRCMVRYSIHQSYLEYCLLVVVSDVE